jgi:hypothetical protein
MSDGSLCAFWQFFWMIGALLVLIFDISLIRSCEIAQDVDKVKLFS